MCLLKHLVLDLLSTCYLATSYSIHMINLYTYVTIYVANYQLSYIRSCILIIQAFFLLCRSIIAPAIALTPLLGGTWFTGLFVINEHTIVLAWIFTILNSLQVCKFCDTHIIVKCTFILGLPYIFLLRIETRKGLYCIATCVRMYIITIYHSCIM